MPRLGVLGTMVWDSIFGPEAGPDDAVHAWGGIAYSLAAADAALGPSWSLFPIAKVGGDLRSEADRFFETLRRVDSLEGVRTVDEPNNRVDLYYHRDDHGRRCERLTGGVPAWRADELVPLVASCDALFVNFIAGWELDLAATRALRSAFGGAIYADLHSLLLSVGEDGIRRLRPLDRWREWMENFDYLQVNEDELGMLAVDRDQDALVSAVLAGRTRAVFITRGERGVEWRCEAAGREGLVAPTTVETGDPTGCGDVFGATCFPALLNGIDVRDAVLSGVEAARRNARHRGAEGLRDVLAAAEPEISSPDRAASPIDAGAA